MAARSTTPVAATGGDKCGTVTVYSPPEKSVEETINPESLFRAGLHLLERGERIPEAVVALERAYNSKPQDARYASYYGLSLALSSKRLKDAEELCAQAVEVEFCRPEFYCNLGRVRLRRNDRKGAYLAFRGGLSVDRNDARIQQEIAKLGRRRPPVIPFLSRRHLLNKLLGMFRSQLDRAKARTV